MTIVDRPLIMELTETARQESQAVLVSVQEAIVHAIRAGEALARLREIVGDDGWDSWVLENVGISVSTCRKYIRLATYREAVLGSGAQNSTQAERYLRGLPAVADPNVRRKTPADIKAEAVRLHAAGVPAGEIAALLDVGDTTVRRLVDPDVHKRWLESKRRSRQRRRAARAALRQRERDELVRASGGSASNAYALLRKTALELDAALRDAGPGEHRLGLREALALVHKAEDEIVKALRVERAA